MDNKEIKLQNELEETYYCDYKSNNIIKHLDDLISINDSITNVVKKVFNFVQNNIKFGMDSVDVKASETLEKGYGACWNKSLLLVALLRNQHVPARVVYDQLKRDFSKPCFGLICHLSNNPFCHGLVQVYLNEKWIRIDPTLDKNTFDKCFKQLGVSWINEWDGATDMKIYAESIIGETIIIEDIDKKYSENFGNAIPPQFIKNYMNKKLWKKVNNKKNYD